MRRIWGAIDSDLVAWGGGGAGLTVARLGRGPSWPCTEHEGAKCRHPPANSVEKNSWLAWIHGSRFLAFHGFPRSVMANTPLSDRPICVTNKRGEGVQCAYPPRPAIRTNTPSYHHHASRIHGTPHRAIVSRIMQTSPEARRCTPAPLPTRRGRQLAATGRDIHLAAHLRCIAGRSDCAHRLGPLDARR